MGGLAAFRNNGQRVDYDIIVDAIPNDSRVLDVGSGDGSLLARLVAERNVRARGLELDQGDVSEAVARGLPIVQGDAERDLADYPDNAFDYVIVSQAIQAMHRPDYVLQEALRIGRHAVVSFPNFGYWRVRLRLALGGSMPVTEALPYCWYNTPNIHFCTISDFHDLCDQTGVRVERAVYLNPHGRPMRHRYFANLLADQAVLTLCRR